MSDIDALLHYIKTDSQLEAINSSLIQRVEFYQKKLSDTE